LEVNSGKQEAGSNEVISDSSIEYWVLDVK